MAAGQSMRAGGIHWAATMDAKGFEQGARAVKRSASGLADSLKSEFGRGSALKESLEVLAGGGVIAGLGLLGGMISDVGTKFRQLSMDMRLGVKTTSDVVNELARSVPVLGGVAGGIADLLIGSGAFGIQDKQIANAARAGVAGISKAWKAELSGSSPELNALDEEWSKVWKARISGGISAEEWDRASEMFTRLREKTIRSLGDKNPGGGVVDLLRDMPDWINGLDPLSQNVLSYADNLKKAEEAFNKAAEAADREVRTAVVIGVNDPMTLHAIEYQQQQTDEFLARARAANDAILDEAKQRQESIVSIAMGLREQFTQVAPRPTVALRGSQAAFSDLNAPSRRQPTEEQMNKLIEKAANQENETRLLRTKIEEKLREMEIGN